MPQVSWWGRSEQISKPSSPMFNSVDTDAIFPKVLAKAKQKGMGLSLHIEPYPERSPGSFEADVDYFLEKYGADLSLLDLPS